MIAPFGGFSANGSSFGSGVPCSLGAGRLTPADGLKRIASAPAVFASSWRRALMSSIAQKPRPCVATIRSSSLIARSRIDVAGRFNRSDCQLSPSSNET